jgi:hypothetical protein
LLSALASWRLLLDHQPLVWHFHILLLALPLLLLLLLHGMLILLGRSWLWVGI